MEMMCQYRSTTTFSIFIQSINAINVTRINLNRLHSINAIDVTRVECQMSIRLNLLSEYTSRASLRSFLYGSSPRDWPFLANKTHNVVSALMKVETPCSRPKLLFSYASSSTLNPRQ